MKTTSVPTKSFSVWIGWQGGSNSTQFLQRALSLEMGVPWTDLLTNLPPTPTAGSFTDALGTNGMQFYRIKAVRWLEAELRPTNG